MCKWALVSDRTINESAADRAALFAVEIELHCNSISVLFPFKVLFSSIYGKFLISLYVMLLLFASIISITAPL